jgi:hypothetical protein
VGRPIDRLLRVRAGDVRPWPARRPPSRTG